MTSLRFLISSQLEAVSSKLAITEETIVKAETVKDEIKEIEHVDAVRTRTENGTWSFSVITVPASSGFNGIHDRMPAILSSQQEIDEWLDPAISSEKVGYFWC